MSDQAELKVLMVCLGNICRSPMAEAVFADLVSKRPGLADGVRIVVDSAGTASYHSGDEPDERTVETCKKHGVPITSQARALDQRDFQTFDHILAMDANNLRNIQNAKPPNSRAQISMFSSHAAPSSSSNPFTTHPDIKDPYYGSGMSGFERCFKQCVEYSNGFLDGVESGEIGPAVGPKGRKAKSG